MSEAQSIADIVNFLKTKVENVKKKLPEIVGTGQAIGREAEQRIQILEKCCRTGRSMEAVKAAAHRTVTENERLRKDMLEKLKRLNAIKASRNNQQWQENHLMKHSNEDMLAKHKKDPEQIGSRIKASIPNGWRYQGWSDPHAIIQCMDQGLSTAQVERRPEK